MSCGQGPGPVVLDDVEVDALAQSAHRLDEPKRLGGGVHLPPAGCEERHRGRGRAELEDDPDVAFELGQDRADRLRVLRAEDAHVPSASIFASRYARYGAGSIVGEPVRRSIVSFGVSLRPSE